MVNRYSYKAVYIRETNNGKTKWVKIPGVEIRNMYSKIQVILDSDQFNELEKSRTWITYTREGRAE